LQRDKWTVVYSKYDFDHANALYDNLIKASGRFGAVVEEPSWCELPGNKE
jgi:hypothetical protein